jgi:hypothetical protein
VGEFYCREIGSRRFAPHQRRETFFGERGSDRLHALRAFRMTCRNPVMHEDGIFDE